jgi:uncharacterized protein YndB with AHSA1/START domain
MLSVCPAAVVAAPAERVWALLADPAGYDRWWDAHTERIEPPGPARAGQVIHGWSRGLGRRWPVRVTVEAVDAERRQLRFHTTLPLGLEMRNQIACAPLDAASCRVQFG